MPELPEVETSRREVHKAAFGRTIRKVNTVDDAIVYDGVSPDEVARALTKRRVLGSHRRGKHFWLELDQRPWPLFHFGMTGWMHIYGAVKDRPAYWKIEIVLDDGARIALRDPRRLGRIRLRHDPLNESPINQLGFDPLHDHPAWSFFREEMSRRKAPIKAVLLDQTFSAGVGNWIADEVLYQSGIDPRRRADSLNDVEIKRLHRKLNAIIQHAVDVGADDVRFPRNWLFHYRWGKTKGAVDGGGRTIAFAQVGGRTTAWVPERQK